MSENKIPSAIDRIVGQRLRWRRRELKWTQEHLSVKLGVTFQQIQKYEKGVNRISAGRLFEIARILVVPVTYFYEGVSELLPSVSQAGFHESEKQENRFVVDPDSIELLAAFQMVDDAVWRQNLLKQVRNEAKAYQERSAK